MDENKRKIAFLDLVLALIVLALFGLAPLSFDVNRGNPQRIQAERDVMPGDSEGTSVLSSSLTSSLSRVSMETVGQPVSASGFVSDIPNQGVVVTISSP